MKNRMTKKELQFLADLQTHQNAIAKFQKYWLSYYGFDLGDPVVPKEPRKTTTKKNPLQMDLWEVCKPPFGKIVGVVCFRSEALIMVRADGEKLAYAYRPEIFQKAVDTPVK